jgi:hypothetical protein
MHIVPSKLTVTGSFVSSNFMAEKPNPVNMGKAEIDAFLSHLATQGKVSASTQRQALNATIFLYRHVLDQPIEDQLEPVKARRYERQPTVMTQSEVQHVMAHLGCTIKASVQGLKC